jgi:hypothetical protein
MASLRKVTHLSQHKIIDQARLATKTAINGALPLTVSLISVS